MDDEFFNPILNGMLDPFKIPVMCLHCGKAITVNIDIKDGDIVICPLCHGQMIAREEKCGMRTALEFDVIDK